MTTENKSPSTFWQLVADKRYGIEIPIIQRDYAQGRDDAHAKRVRESLLEALFNALISKDKNTPLKLDFVYGRIKNNKLIPLDGQQRLTTLFLLHWYLAVRENQHNNEVCEVLQKFTYETRISSRDFCQELAKERLNNFDHTIEKAVSVFIENQAWFFPAWKKDPTIQSMLTMLDNINSKYNELGSEMHLFERITSENRIVFDFLDMGELLLSDDLYIKMNSRGKPLTLFENFKATFFKLDVISNDIKGKFDNEWTDLFWRFKDEQLKIDDQFLNFVTNITHCFYLETSEKVEFNLFRDYSSVYSDEYKNIDRFETLLDSLSELLKSDVELKELFEKFIAFNLGRKENKTTYWDRAKFYALALFVIKNPEISLLENNEPFINWKRVTFNLINNTLIQSEKNFHDAIAALYKLSQNSDDIYVYLRGESPKISSFLQKQWNEEILKAKLFVLNAEWIIPIIEAEKHEYFDGQIGFILSYAKNESEVNAEDLRNYSLSLFRKYYSLLDIVFRKNFSNANCFRRALLTKGNYLVEEGDNLTFCSFETALRTKNDNWRKVFDGKEKSGWLKSLLENIEDTESIDGKLNEIIENYLSSKESKDDKYYYFIKYPLVIEYCEKLQIRKFENTFLLLSRYQTNGYHAEYYTYSLYCAMDEVLKGGFEYVACKSREDKKGIKHNSGGWLIYWGEEGFTAVIEKEPVVFGTKVDEETIDNIRKICDKSTSAEIS